MCAVCDGNGWVWQSEMGEVWNDAGTCIRGRAAIDTEQAAIELYTAVADEMIHMQPWATLRPGMQRCWINAVSSWLENWVIPAPPEDDTPDIETRLANLEDWQSEAEATLTRLERWRDGR